MHNPFDSRHSTIGNLVSNIPTSFMPNTDGFSSKSDPFWQK